LKTSYFIALDVLEYLFYNQILTSEFEGNNYELME
jgi:hypothetical protein